MYQRDYILRLIERFGRMLIAIRNRILQREMQTAEVLAQIREVAQEAGLDLDIARTLDPASLLMWLSPTGEIDAPRMWLLAELLSLEALQARSSAAAGWRPGLERALAIYSRLPSAWKPSDEFLTAGERVIELRRLLQDADAS